MLSSIRRAATLIDAFIGPEREKSVSDLARELDMPQPTVHHFLAAFREAGWIVQNPVTKRYRLSVRMWEIGCAAVNFREAAESARPFLQALVASCNETVHLGMIAPEDPFSVVYIDRVDSTQPLRVITALGSSAPSHSSAMGKAIVAHNRDFERAVLERDLPPVTASTITDRKALQKDFEATRKRGYSLSRGEFDIEMVGLAAPVRDRVGLVTLGIGIWAPATRLTVGRIKEIAPQLLASARGLSTQRGYVARISD